MSTKAMYGVEYQTPLIQEVEFKLIGTILAGSGEIGNGENPGQAGA